MCLFAGVGALAAAPALRAQLVSASVIYAEPNASITTLGGGPLETCGPVSGDTDGNTYLDSQFNGPVAMALNSQGTLFVADRTNRAIREVTLAGNTGSSQTTSLFSSFISASSNELTGLAVDAGDNLYILVQGANAILKYNSSFNELFSFSLPSRPSAFAVSLDNKTNIFVTFTNGAVIKYVQNGSSIVSGTTLVASGLVKWQPSGIAWRDDGLLAVSDLTKNGIYLVSSTNNYAPTLYIGSSKGYPGWVDGPPPFAQFNQPAALAWSADGQLVVADRSNNALRRIDSSGTASTIYGVTNTFWGATDCADGIYAGWVDGGAGAYGTNATGRAPTSVLLAPSGEIFVTELAYSLLREVSGVGLLPVVNTNIVTGTNTATNIVIAPPLFGPNSGYYPACQTIAVTSTVPLVYYTLDGSAPTTNSFPVVNMTNNVADGEYEGSFLWCNSFLDLSSLQLIASNGTNTSVVTTGQSTSVNEIGFPAPTIGGVGSIAIVPLVINLVSNQTLASLQFRVEVNPTTANTPQISSLTLLPISTNDFVTLAGPAPGNAPVNYQPFGYTNTSGPYGGQGLLILASGTNSGFTVQKFAAAVVLEFQIPPTALPGQTYELTVLDPSGTSDGAQGNVPIIVMANQTLTVSNVQYFVGDSSPSLGYSAGEFGDGILNNADVNNALFASVGIHVPFPGTDAFNAMDVYPEISGSPGKGFITYLDAQLILFRSVGLDTNNFVRFWSLGGLLDDERIAWSPGSPAVAVGQTPAELSLAVTTSTLKTPPTPPGQVWLRQAALVGGNVGGLLPGNTASIPISVRVLPGSSLAGLQFRASLQPNGAAPLPGAVKFTSASGIPVPAEYAGLSVNESVCVWSLLDPFSPALTGSNLLGTISFQVPADALLGQSYTLRFLAVGGAPDLDTLYQLESIPGSAWVATAPATPPAQTSDEWKTNFFGSLTNALAADKADPDGDGVANWQEYLAGTDPTNPLSNLKFSGASPVAGNPRGVALSWLTAPGRKYVLESAPALGGTSWTGVSTNLGDGDALQLVLTNYPGNAVFYRIRLQP
jgi:hypothetical protein